MSISDRANEIYTAVQVFGAQSFERHLDQLVTIPDPDESHLHGVPLRALIVYSQILRGDDEAPTLDQIRPQIRAARTITANPIDGDLNPSTLPVTINGFRMTLGDLVAVGWLFDHTDDTEVTA